MSTPIKVCCISDTHCLHEDIEVGSGDILIHSGDFTLRGTSEEVHEFADWLERQAYTHKIVVAGNHELSFDTVRFEKSCQKFAAKPTLLENMKRKCDPNIFKAILTDIPGCVYLEDSSVDILGYTFHGSPYIPPINDWAFMLRPEERKAKWSLIPSSTDVLITHSPPYGVLDGGHIGCAELLEEVLSRVKPSHHIFGHAHDGYGELTREGVVFHNAASCNDRYKAVNAPLVFMLDKR